MKKIGEQVCSFHEEHRKKILMMRNTVLILLISAFQVFANGSYSQTAQLNLNLKNATIKQVLTEIENQSEFYFLYNSELIDVTRKVDISVKNEKVNEILSRLFNDNEVNVSISDRHIVLTPVTEKSDQQQKSVSGKVTDSNNQPLPGVTVLIKGTAQGTITNADGNYSLTNIPENTVLLFSFVGMKTQVIVVGSQKSINIVMEEMAIGIEEVVAVGYGVMKKSDITGSVASISSLKLENRPNVSLNQMLQGNVAGLNIRVSGDDAEGSKTSVSIRTNNSITASNSPLIILDGVPFSGNLSELNPNDIKSIEVLKDASSSAIYGSRGANGVMIISSKKGEKGKMKVRYSAYYTFEQVTNIPKMMDGQTFAQTKLGRGQTLGVIEQMNYDAGKTTDWLKLCTQPGHKNQHDLSVSGGGEKFDYFISTSLADVKGISKGDDFTRVSLRLNFNMNLTKWLTFGTNTLLGYYDRSGIAADLSEAYDFNPLAEPYNEDGSIRLKSWDDPVHGFNPLNPTLADNTDNQHTIFSNTYFLVDIPFIKGLTYKFNTGYTYSSRSNNTYYGKNTQQGFRDNGNLSINNAYHKDWIIENIFNYKKEFNKNTLFLTGLYSAQSEYSESNIISSQNFFSDDLSYFQPNNGLTKELSMSSIKKTHISQMFRLNYSFESRYLFTSTIRRDGYSAFGKNSKFGLFPSAAIGWNITGESFSEPLRKYVNTLKLRLSYGINGNEAISAYSTIAALSENNYIDATGKTAFGYFSTQIKDQNLRWEKTASFNGGIDFGAFSNRITGAFDIFWNQTSDLLLNKTISPINGDVSVLQNIGATKGKGYELEISSVNIDKGNFKWSTSVNWTKYLTEIVNVGLTDSTGNYIDDIASKWFIGHPVNVEYNYKFDGIWQENQTGTYMGDVKAGDIKVLDADGDGKLTPLDRVILYSDMPDFTLGINNTFKYKNWTLYFFLNGVFGIENKNVMYEIPDGELRVNLYSGIHFWTAENASNDYPRNAARADVNKYSVSLIRHASFLRLQDISLTYSFPKKWLSGAGIEGLDVYTNIKNLYTLTNWEGFDPEINSRPDYPMSRSIYLGLKLNF